MYVHTCEHTNKHAHIRKQKIQLFIQQVSKSLGERQICIGGRISDSIKYLQLIFLGRRWFHGCVYWKELYPSVVHPGVFSGQEIGWLRQGHGMVFLSLRLFFPLWLSIVDSHGPLNTTIL